MSERTMNEIEQREADVVQRDRENLIKQVADLASEKMLRDERVRRLEEALRFYADEKNWESDTVDVGIGPGIEIPHSAYVDQDCGATARAALADIPLPGTAGRIERLTGLVREQVEGGCRCLDCQEWIDKARAELEACRSRRWEK